MHCNKHRPISATASEQGFTLIEFVVVLVVLSVVASLAAGIYVFSTQWVTRWQATIDAENSAHLLAQQVARDVKYAGLIQAYGDSLWMVRQRNGREVTYRFVDSLVYRNERPVAGDGVSVPSFFIRVDTLYEEEGQPTSAIVGRFIVVGVTVKTRHAEVDVHTGIAGRHTEPWSTTHPLEP